jgi:hypothetical protein
MQDNVTTSYNEYAGVREISTYTVVTLNSPDDTTITYTRYNSNNEIVGVEIRDRHTYELLKMVRYSILSKFGTDDLLSSNKRDRSNTPDRSDKPDSSNIDTCYKGKIQQTGYKGVDLIPEIGMAYKNVLVTKQSSKCVVDSDFRLIALYDTHGGIKALSVSYEQDQDGNIILDNIIKNTK